MIMSALRSMYAGILCGNCNDVNGQYTLSKRHAYHSFYSLCVSLSIYLYAHPDLDSLYNQEDAH